VTLTEAVKHLRYWFSKAGTECPVPLKRVVLAPEAAGSRRRQLRGVYASPAPSRGLEPEYRLDRQGWFGDAEGAVLSGRRWTVAENRADGAQGDGLVRDTYRTAGARSSRRSTCWCRAPGSGPRSRWSEGSTGCSQHQIAEATAQTPAPSLARGRGIGNKYRVQAYSGESSRWVCWLGCVRSEGLLATGLVGATRRATWRRASGREGRVGSLS